jgi:hypothetical protein
MMQLNFTSVIFPLVIMYHVPDPNDLNLRGLLRVMTTAYANGWNHLGKLAHEQIKGLLENRYYEHGS